MDKIKIKITTVQTIDEAGNEDTVELLTEAFLHKNENNFTIDYDESDITETKGSKTRLKIYKNKMIMTKIGMFSTKMEFECGESFENIYTTPYGSFQIYFNTVLYQYSLDERGRGSVNIEYKIVFGKTSENYNKLKIEIY